MGGFQGVIFGVESLSGLQICESHREEGESNPRNPKVISKKKNFFGSGFKTTFLRAQKDLEPHIWTVLAMFVKFSKFTKISRGFLWI